MLQIDEALIDSIHDRGFRIAVETNGTIEAPPAIDWICVSPKGQNRLKQIRGQELKLIWPQAGIDPAEFAGLDFERFYLQPKDPLGADKADAARHTQMVIDYCLAHPQWRMSVQTHKLVGLK